ncbi:MAG: hypothetical protein ACRYGP_23565 [Janthinobacterium lividum]
MITAAQTRKARAVMGWSQADLAKASGISLEAIMVAEGIGPRFVPLATKIAIVKAFKAAGIEVVSSGINFVGPDHPHPSGRR